MFELSKLATKLVKARKMTEAPKKETNDPLLQPFAIGKLRLKNRIMSTSHAAGLGDNELPGERYQRYHEEKAKGGLALTMFGGSTNIAPDSPSVFNQLRVDSDEIIPFLQEFSDRIHRYGTALMIQITHLGRRGEATAGNWLPTIAPSSVRETLHRSIPREMDRNDIDRVVKAYGEAAKRCKEGGLDGLETVAGGHLIGQFFSRDTNHRTDEFGGSIQNRARFALMVYEEMRRQVGDDFLMGIRLSLNEGDAALTFEEALEIASILRDEGAVNFFNCNMGRMDTELALAEYNMPGMTRHLAPFVDQVGLFKKEIGLPVFHAARITDVANARRAVKEGLLDMVAMTRAHIADPQIVAKIERGDEDRIRPCIGMSHCMHKKIHCVHNPATGRETALPQVVEKSDQPGKKVIIVGGGPAGLEAARVAAERGHQVTLYEAAAKLGGQLLIAAKASWRNDLISLVDWRISELEHLGVDVRLNHFVEPSDLENSDVDVILIATGGVPRTLPFEGSEFCLSTWDLLNGDVQPASRILVYDGTGRHEAASTTDHLSRQGAEVLYASIDPNVGGELGYAERPIYRKRFYQQGVVTLPDVKLSSVQKNGNLLTVELVNDLSGQITSHSVDQVVVEVGTVPNDELFKELKSRSSNRGITNIEDLLASRPQSLATGQQGPQLHLLGDAVSSRSLHAAILDAYRIAVAL